MKNWKSRRVVILFTLGIILVLCAPYVPDLVFIAVSKMDYHYLDFRYDEIVPSTRIAGLVLSAWGIVVYCKDKNFDMNKNSALIIAMAFTCSCLFIPVQANEADASMYRGSIDLCSIIDDPNVTASEVMTYDEMIRHYAQNEGLTYAEAEKRFPAPRSADGTNDIGYRTFTANLDVTSEYKPHLEFYCETAEGGHFFNINSIHSVKLVQIYGSISKQFSGDIEVWLRSSNSIEYVVNGDFYDNGTTTSSGGVGLDINLGQRGKVSFWASIASADNHYAPFYKHTTVYYGR